MRKSVGNKAKTEGRRWCKETTTTRSVDDVDESEEKVTKGERVGSDAATLNDVVSFSPRRAVKAPE